MTIAPIMKIDKEEMGDMRILQIIDDGAYVWICRVYSDVYKKYPSHAFVYDSIFAPLYKSGCYGAIIDNRYYELMFVPEDKDRTRQTTLKIALKIFLKDVALWTMHSNLLQMILYNISWRIIDYPNEYWLKSLEDWRRKNIYKEHHWTIDWYKFENIY